jgi:hypothetical protein
MSSSSDAGAATGDESLADVTPDRP